MLLSKQHNVHSAFIHFVFYCVKHETLRDDYLNHLLDNDYNEVENLKLIFQDTERSKQFAKYLLEAYENRVK